jgi:hypothetical protein
MTSRRIWPVSSKVVSGSGQQERDSTFQQCNGERGSTKAQAVYRKKKKKSGRGLLCGRLKLETETFLLVVVSK